MEYTQLYTVNAAEKPRDNNIKSLLLARITLSHSDKSCLRVY